MRVLATIVALALCAGACKRKPPPRRELPEVLPARYPIPAGGELSESVELGRVATLVFSYAERAPDEVIAELRAGLELIDWPVSGKGARVVTEEGDRQIAAKAEAEGSGARLVIEIRDRAPPDAGPPPGPDAAPLAAPPQGYPLGFPFLPGAVPGEGPKGAVVLIYGDEKPAAIAGALRARAERQQWMCTQGARSFVCAAGARSVDVRLSPRGGGTALTVISSP